MKIFKLLFLISLPIFSFSQVDTLYYSNKWEITNKDSAKYFGVISKSESFWKKQDYYSSNGQLQMSGTFLDSTCVVKSGLFVWYRENGILKDSIFYENNQIKEAWYFHKNGNKSAHEVFSEGKMVKNLMWNENGLVIDKNYRDTVYKSPFKTWKEYVLLSMELNQPKAYRKGKIDGSVVIQFYIGIDGYIIDATVLHSSGHKELDEHALNIIKNSPRWTPARQHGRKVISRREQKFVYHSLLKFED